MTEEQIMALMNGAEPDVRIGFILTQEGRMWNADGLRAATDKVNELYPPRNATPADGILWLAGHAINDPVFLAQLLTDRQDAYIMMSMSPKSILLPNDDGKAGLIYAGALVENAGDDLDGPTSWEILKAVLEKFGKGPDMI